MTPLTELMLAFAAFGLVTVLPGFAVIWLARRLAELWRRHSAERAGAARGASHGADPADARFAAPPSPGADPAGGAASLGVDAAGAASAEAGGAASPGADAAGTPSAEADPAPLVLAVATTAVAFALLGGALLALGEFSARKMAAAALVTGLAGVPPLVAWLRTLLPARLSALYLTALTLPFVASAVPAARLAPAWTFQWYYAGLGRQLNAAGGVPEWVTEYGRQVRWLPDYLFFNVTSEAYRGLMALTPDARAITLFRAPAALLGVIAVYLVLRLWFRRPAAFAGVGAAVASTTFTGKFNTYHPEAVALPLALLAAWLAVQALRRRRPGWLLLGGALWGVTMGMHAIGATVGGLLLVAAVTVEWLGGARGSRARAVPALAAGAVAALAVTLATGWALQGRALVAGDAARPKLEGSYDPGLAFRRYAYGDFSSSNRVGSGNEFPTEALDHAWPTLTFSKEPVAAAILALLVAGSLLTLALGRGPPRRGVIAIVAFAALIAAAIAYFTLAFETYVPRHTGLLRFAEYVPLVYGLGVGAGLQGALLAWERRLRRPVPDLSAAVAAALAVLVMALTAGPLTRGPGLPGPARESLAELTRLARPGDAVISNAATRGTLEFFAGLESPLEGRQPFLESAGFLRSANKLLLDAHRWFLEPGELARLRRLGARWVIVVSDPSALGARDSYAATPGLRPFRSQPWLRERLRAPGLAVFEFSGAARPSTARLGPPQERFGRYVAALAGLAAILGVTALGLRRRRHEPSLGEVEAAPGAAR